jgi:hypothetical protein
MANTNYFRVDLSDINLRAKKIYSAEYAQEIPNGVLGYLGGFKEGSTEIREFVAPTADLIKAKLPVIVMKPEINYAEDRKTDGALGIFRNPANKAFPVIQLEDLEGIDLSEDYFDLTGKENGKVEVGDIFVLQPNAVAGTQLKYSESAPETTVAGHYFRVVGVVNSHIANYVYTDGTATASMFPQAYKMVQLEIVKIA